MTVSEAFQQFKGTLELPTSYSRTASAAQQELRQRLGVYLPIQESFLTGSYARHTKIHPLNDIDVMLVRNTTRVGLTTSGGVLPSQALDEVAQAARSAFGSGVGIKKQSRSVNLSFADLDFGFDVIPAWLRQPDGYWIPDIDGAGWIPTDPHTHAQIMTDANDRSAGRLKPVIKMVKHWSRNNLDVLCSFHLELVCEWVFRQAQVENLQMGVALVLVRLPQVVGQKVMDPVYGLSRVDKPLSLEQLQKLQRRANYDADNVRTAIQLEASGKDTEAIHKWQHIFLAGFPS
jgi:Second Messenger Oligonucleotide or Dinucleotide Synthetase domain